MRILFITATRIGDAVLSTGILDALIRRHPEAEVTIACGPVAEGVFARMPNRVRTIVLRKHKYRLHWLGFWRQAAGTRWDLVVDLRASVFSWMVWTRRRIVSPGGGRIPGHRTRHLGALLGLDPPPLPVAWFSAADAARAASLLPPGGAPWIALGPTANWHRKVWPAERFVALYRRLSAPDGMLPGARAVILGGPGAEEAAMAAPVIAALGAEALDLTGALALPEVAAVLARAALFVGNDSGLMHLAAATGTPTLGLFGPSRVEEYAPAGRRAAFVASPTAPGLDSMPGLTVEAALAGAERLLATKVPA